MYATPRSNRLHIGIFGRRNVGKSSLINALSGQNLAIVSEIAGTTTDPVYKSMEILPVGPCVLIDTAGLDDDGFLGRERIKKTLTVLRKIDLGLIVVEPDFLWTDFEDNLTKTLKEKKIPFIFVINKNDLKQGNKIEKTLRQKEIDYIKVSAKKLKGIEELKEKIIKLSPQNWNPVPLVRDILKPKKAVVLVCPIDSAMPQGRLILPEVQVLRDVLDSDAMGFVTKETELQNTLLNLKEKPQLVITDSQVFETVKNIVPEDIPLTSFSIIFSRHRGDINIFLKGVLALEKLEDGDEILIAEACTHHPQPEDIGRTKIPTWLTNITGKNLNFDNLAGGEFPEDLSRYKMIIHCGSCMINRKEMLSRIEKAKKQNIPITNYGVLIGYIAGILNRVIEPLKQGIVPIEI